jgi:hypothetical protein
MRGASPVMAAGDISLSVSPISLFVVFRCDCGDVKVNRNSTILSTHVGVLVLCTLYNQPMRLNAIHPSNYANSNIVHGTANEAGDDGLPSASNAPDNSATPRSPPSVALPSGRFKL